MVFSSDDDNVKKLPVKFKTPIPPERSLVEVQLGKCTHRSMFGAAYAVDESLAEVECSLCAAKLNPMWVLAQLASDDRRYFEAHQRYHDEMKRLKERSRTKCNSCGVMTLISR